MSGSSPTARALRALDVLQSRPGVTAAELGERLTRAAAPSPRSGG